MFNYLSAESLTKEEFQKKKVNLIDSDNSILTSPEDISRIENILDLSEGLLEGMKFYVSKMQCDCGRQLSFYDLIFTALVEQWHDPSFIAHTLIGSKYFVNEPGPFRCSSCGRSSHRIARGGFIGHYDLPAYGCCLP
ncbi:hypothetical protein AAFN47_12560 [Hoeflea sp. CAU 1731]